MSISASFAKSVSTGLYGVLPVLLQNVAITAYGVRRRRQKFGGKFKAFLRGYQERARQPEDVVTQFRDARLRGFVQHAVRTTPYYRELFQALRLRPEDIRSIADLAALPVLTKHEVQSRVDDFISEAVPKRAHAWQHTSGTTGGGLVFPATRDAIREQWAVWWRHRRLHGQREGSWTAAFGGRLVVPPAAGRPPYWRYDYFGRTVFFSGYHMSESTLGLYVNRLRQFPSVVVAGYPSHIALLAGHVLSMGGGGLRNVSHVFLFAENVLVHQRDVIREAFGVSPREHYGLSEGVANASECTGGNLHIDEDYACVELLSAHNEETCRIVGTNFTNPAFPLLRYDAGDTCSIGKRCSCGLPGRTLTQIDGRKEDYVILANGAAVGRLDHIFKDMLNVREAQIRQYTPGRIEVLIVRGRDYSISDEMQVLGEFRQRLGDELQVGVKYVSDIERTQRGKLRFVVNEIANAKL